MIKLVCPICQDEGLFPIREEEFDEWFRCDNCGKEFTFQDSQWEFDS